MTCPYRLEDNGPTSLLVIDHNTGTTIGTLHRTTGGWVGRLRHTGHTTRGVARTRHDCATELWAIWARHHGREAS